MAAPPRSDECSESAYPCRQLAPPDAIARRPFALKGFGQQGNRSGSRHHQRLGRRSDTHPDEPGRPYGSAFRYLYGNSLAAVARAHGRSIFRPAVMRAHDDRRPKKAVVILLKVPTMFISRPERKQNQAASSGGIWHLTLPFFALNAAGILWCLSYPIRRNLIVDGGFDHGFTGTSTHWEEFAGFTYLLPHRLWSK